MGELLLPVGVPIGPRYAAAGSRAEAGGSAEAAWRIGTADGIREVGHREYVLWSIAFAALERPALVAALAIAEDDGLCGAGDGTGGAAGPGGADVVDGLLGGGLLLTVDPAWPPARLLAVWDRVRLLPAGVGHGNPPPDPARHRIRDRRGDTEITCTAAGYEAYFASRGGSLGAVLRRWPGTLARSCAEVAELVTVVLRSGLGHLDLSSRSHRPRGRA